MTAETYTPDFILQSVSADVEKQPCGNKIMESSCQAVIRPPSTHILVPSIGCEVEIPAATLS